MTRKELRFTTTLAFVFAAAVFGNSSAQAAVINGGFESGTFSGWTTAGDASVVTSAFGIAPASGTYQALVEGGSANLPSANLESFLGVGGGSLNALGNGITHGGSAIAQTFTATGNQTLSFTWDFITDEQPQSVFNDFAFWSLKSSLSTLATANGSKFVPFGALLQTGSKTLSVVLPATGTYTLVLGVANVSDNGGLPQLLVDNISLASVPEPASAALLAVALASAFAMLRSRPRCRGTLPMR